MYPSKNTTAMKRETHSPSEQTKAMPVACSDTIAHGAAVSVFEIETQGATCCLSARLYTPDALPDNHGLIVFFPCGAFIATEFDRADAFARLLAATTAHRVMVCATTPASMRPFPAAAEDAHAVLKWAVKHRARLGWSGSRLIVAGLESGGNLAAVAAMMARDRSGPALAAQILIMPMLDPGLTTGSMCAVNALKEEALAAGACARAYREYLPRAVDRSHPYASPLRSSRMKGLAPTLILSAQDDPLRDEAEEYGAKLMLAGVRTVIWRLSPVLFAEPNARANCVRQKAALQEIADFLLGLRGRTTLPDAGA